MVLTAGEVRSDYMPLALRRFFRYSIVGVSTFAIDLAILWVLIDFFEVNLFLAAAIGFLIGVSINYAVSRVWVYQGTNRSFTRGYVYFLILALVGVGATILLMWLLTAFTNLHYITVRVIVAGFVGLSTYLLNLHLNFRVVGEELGEVESRIVKQH